MKRQFINYCRLYWDISDYDVERAISLMDRSHCSLEQASAEIADFIRDLADDFTTENDLEEDWFSTAFEDIEEVFWEVINDEPTPTHITISADSLATFTHDKNVID